ncbi:hypothetical protein predicted by Glimmer/Critica [Sorangium cellulosum So ce56]|uniref:Uncharacterized protein n=1 Tax=Sorangium cellulosum (strain So ce56) TaxID=448385 RepID=A9GEC0_SORC5|nr:hypothetical protein [Sorangium cellulosum]CAN99471.1 hypothetical protein predicted by Glimmer/Critica [Sorangium cellulosum So ce56]
MATSRSTEPSAPIIVKHPGCPQWGLGYLVEERDEKRFYDFEDGLNHSIAKAFWSKLEPVQLGDDEASALEARIRGLRDRPSAAAKKQRARVVAPPVTSFDEQVASFESQFEGGFGGPQFIAEERGAAGGEGAEGPASGGKKKSKAFKQGAIETARALLAKGELEALLAAGNLNDFMERITKVHKAATGLLHPLGDLIPFNKMPAEHHRAYAEAVVDLLYGAGDYAARFDRLAGVLAAAKVVTWPLVTILGALVYPGEHVFVKPSFYEKQAAVLGFDLAYDRAPSAEGYVRMQSLARELERRLRERGLAPRDLMDVYAFLWRTISPSKPATKS